MKTKLKGAKQVLVPNLVVDPTSDTFVVPPIGRLMSNFGTAINPPSPAGGDRSGPDKQRYNDRQKAKTKGKINDILGGNPVITQPGKIKVPVEGGYEPKWRPGRDGKGGSGSGNGKAGDQPGEYVEMSFEEFLELFFESLNLPFMLKKQMAQSMVKSFHRRGVSATGPKARLNKKQSAIERLKRAISEANNRPEDFVPDFAQKCQDVFEAYVFWAGLNTATNYPKPLFNFVEANIEEFLSKVESADVAIPVIVDSEKSAYRKAIVDSVTAYLESNNAVIAPVECASEDLIARIKAYVFTSQREGNIVPSVEEVPFHKNDLRYNRLEERDDPDSKAVVFLLLDRSGSMTGDPLVIAKAYFFLNVLFLKGRYKTVKLVLISHDAQDYMWKTEEEFFKIGAGGGTVAVPAWELTYKVAQTGATCKQTNVTEGPFSVSEWNRYMFHATDGQLFDGADVIQNWWTKILSQSDAAFSFAGYLEIGNSWGGYSKDWDLGGQALIKLPSEIKDHLGMARVNSLSEVADAFVQILTKDRKKGD